MCPKGAFCRALRDSESIRYNKQTLGSRCWAGGNSWCAGSRWPRQMDGLFSSLLRLWLVCPAECIWLASLDCLDCSWAYLASKGLFPPEI
jgi:hypothetical protein